MRPRPCLDCGRIQAHGTRCAGCYREQQRQRNHARADLYGPGWRMRSLRARQAQPWCSVCGSPYRLELDHEHGQVECRKCNLAHRRKA